MKNTSILLIVVLLIIVILGGLLYLLYYNQEEAVNTNVTEVSLNVNDTIEATLTEDNWAPAETGDISASGSVTFRDTTFTITSAARKDAFRGGTAEDGKDFLVLYLREIPIAQHDAVLGWATAELHLTDSSGASYAMERMKIISEYSDPAETGFFQFTVPEDASGFALQFGSGDEATTLDLGF